jgi:hypothetical protein
MLHYAVTLYEMGMKCVYQTLSFVRVIIHKFISVNEEFHELFNIVIFFFFFSLAEST